MNALPEETLETFKKNFLVQGLPEAAARKWIPEALPLVERIKF